MAKTLWSGRFQSGPHPLLAQYSESISFDRELAEVDIRGSLAHAKMLRAIKVLTAKDLAGINRGMKAILKDIRSGQFEYRIADEDIHMAIEAELTRRIGDPARKLHTARSRNDQVATDFRLWTREAIDQLDQDLNVLQANLVKLAEANRDLVIPGFTHLQRAQPVLLAQHLLAYVEMFARDRERLADGRKRVNRLPLGACAMAGTTLPIDREMVRKELGFDSLCMNSMDAVSDRDFCVELLSGLSLIMAHTSRFCEDVIHWASSEWGLITLADEWSTGSSIMPQKRNPDLLELARGKTGRVYGALTSLLTLLKGLPMTYNRDLQEDKPQVFDAVRTVHSTLHTLGAFAPSLQFNAEVADAMLVGGFLEATVVAEYLVEKGLPFRHAHEVSGTLVRMAEERQATLGDLALDEMQAVCDLFDHDILARLSPAKAVHAYKSSGSAGTREVRRALTRWKRTLKI
ncbi:MAG: argininosuccinate lyase [Planctomycetota bacterium]|jgi:argininosuccinate lyase